ncbi:MAG: type II secretion system protein GspC, partial [Gammaproteobacteria bacterium]
MSGTKLSSRNLVLGIEITLVVLIALSLANFAWTVFPAPTGSVVSVTDQFTGNNPDSAMDTSIASARPTQVLKDMFGRAGATGTEQRFVEENIQETQLNLTLKGILADETTDRKLALIAVAGQKESVYKAGDSIEGAEILDIEARRVLIRRNGVTEALNLDVKIPRSGNTSTAPNVRYRTDTNPSSMNNQPGGIRRISESERVVSEQTFREQLQNLPQLMQQARAVPYSENGRQAGFRVVEVQDGSIFQDLGIEREDVIQSVNGRPVRNVDDALKAYSNLKTARSFQLDLLRRGRPLTIDFS